MQKTYALFDLIGITNALAFQTAAETLESFWNAADAWTNTSNLPVVRIPSKGYSTTPEVFVSTFSDSALLHAEPEIAIDDFYRIVKNFKSFIESKACPSYVVISCSDEIAQPALPAIGGYVMANNSRPRYQRVAGSGNAWVNMHFADAAIKRQKNWHGKYSVYCVGQESLPTSVGYVDCIDCRGLSGSTKVYAIE